MQAENESLSFTNKMVDGECILIHKKKDNIKLELVK